MSFFMFSVFKIGQQDTLGYVKGTREIKECDSHSAACFVQVRKERELNQAGNGTTSSILT